MKFLENKLSGYFSNQPHILIAYLFGSQVTGQTHKESDVDLALLFRADKIPSTEGVQQMEDDITSLLKQETDLIVLNQAPPVIKMQVLRKGKKILERDRRAYSDFFVKTINEYDDLKRVRAVVEKNILKGRIYG